MDRQLERYIEQEGHADAYIRADAKDPHTYRNIPHALRNPLDGCFVNDRHNIEMRGIESLLSSDFEEHAVFNNWHVLVRDHPVKPADETEDVTEFCAVYKGETAYKGEKWSIIMGDFSDPYLAYSTMDQAKKEVFGRPYLSWPPRGLHSEFKNPLPIFSDYGADYRGISFRFLVFTGVGLSGMILGAFRDHSLETFSLGAAAAAMPWLGEGLEKLGQKIDKKKSARFHTDFLYGYEAVSRLCAERSESEMARCHETASQEGFAIDKDTIRSLFEYVSMHSNSCLELMHDEDISDSRFAKMLPDDIDKRRAGELLNLIIPFNPETKDCWRI